MESVACDVVLLPEGRVADIAIEVSKVLEQKGTLFTLNKEDCFPHVSIYMLQLKTGDLDETPKIIENIANKFSKFNLESSRYFEKMQFVDVEYQKTDLLGALHKDVVEALNSLRDGMSENDKIRLETAEGIAKKNFEKYGTKGVFELFRPHLTFTRFKVEQPDIVDLLPKDISQFDGIYSHLGLFEMGKDGTCIRKIAVTELR